MFNDDSLTRSLAIFGSIASMAAGAIMAINLLKSTKKDTEKMKKDVKDIVDKTVEKMEKNMIETQNQIGKFRDNVKEVIVRSNTAKYTVIEDAETIEKLKKLGVINITDINNGLSTTDEKIDKEDKK